MKCYTWNFIANLNVNVTNSRVALKCSNSESHLCMQAPNLPGLSLHSLRSLWARVTQPSHSTHPIGLSWLHCSASPMSAPEPNTPECLYHTFSLLTPNLLSHLPLTLPGLPSLLLFSLSAPRPPSATGGQRRTYSGGHCKFTFCMLTCPFPLSRNSHFHFLQTPGYHVLSSPFRPLSSWFQFHIGHTCS